MYNARNYPVPDEFNEHAVAAVTNNGPKPFRAGHAGKTHELAPGETRFLPWHAVIRWVGDPFAVNIGSDSANHWRVREQDRLSTLYGTYSDPWVTDEPYEIIDPTGPAGMKALEYVQREDGKYYHPHLPDLTVTSTDGKPLVTVLQDPEGADVTPAEQTSLTEQRTLAATVAELQRQLAQQQLLLAQVQGNNSREVSDEFIGDSAATDTPSVTPEPKDPTPGRPTVGDPRSTRGPGRPRKA